MFPAFPTESGLKGAPRGASGGLPSLEQIFSGFFLPDDLFGGTTQIWNLFFHHIKFGSIAESMGKNKEIID